MMKSLKLKKELQKFQTPSFQILFKTETFSNIMWMKISAKI